MPLEPISEINEVHRTYLGTRYAQAVSYLKEAKPEKRRSYVSFEGSVFELNNDNGCLDFQSERLLPEDNSNRTRVLLLFSNAHPESIKNGMFHTAESGVADLWNDLCTTELFSADRGVLNNPGELRNHCLHGNYSSRFILGFVTYWIFPTFHPKHLKELFGKAREPYGFENTKERFNLLLDTWKPNSIICFNGEVFEDVTGLSTKRYTEHIKGELFHAIYNHENNSFPIFLTFPAAWRWVKDAAAFRQRSLKRIIERL